MKFYYTAISTSAKKKLVGSISAKSEKETREKLNKAGMAILSITTEKPDNWDAENIFEFEVLDKRNEKFLGEIAAENEGTIFDRLNEEFEFKKINYICNSTASEEEKMKARESSVREIILEKQKEKEEKANEEMRTFSGSLKALAKMKITEKEEDDESSAENSEKFSNEGEEDFTKKTEADFPQIQKNEKGIEKIDSDVDGGNENSKKSESRQKRVGENMKNNKLNFADRIRIWEDKFIRFFPNFSKKAAKFYYYFTEIVVPLKGKARADGWKEMKKFLFSPKDPAEITRVKKEAVMKRKAFFERLWISFEEIIDVLAAVFLAYFVLGMFALYTEIPRINELAESTLRGNLTIPFLAGTFIFFRLLLLIREKFTSWSFTRTLLLFLAGGVTIGFVGLNLF